MNVTAGRIAVNSAWVILARWSLRLLGVVSTVVLARLLTPEDYGLVAMATLVVGFLQVFSETGLSIAIIRLGEVSRAHYDTAWTLRAIIGIAITAALIFVAPSAVSYFQEPRVEVVIYTLALGPFLGGLSNIGTVDFRRELRFEREFKLQTWPKLASVAVTISLSFVWLDYRALVAGILSQQVASIILGYLMHPYRPSVSFAKTKELWSISIWSLVANIAFYASGKIDELVIGRIYDVAQMGRYHVGASVGAMTVGELIAPPARVLYASFARLLDDANRLRETYLNVVSVLFALAIAASIGLASVAKDATLLLLGEKWQSVSTLVPWLALAAGMSGVTGTNCSMLTALGHARLAALSQLLFACSLVPMMLTAQAGFGVEGIAMARTLCAAALFASVQGLTCLYLGIAFGSVFSRAWRPLLASIAMLAMIQAVQTLAISELLVRLPLEIAAGGFVFCVVQFLLWFVARMPEGVELLIWQFVRAKLKRGGG